VVLTSSARASTRDVSAENAAGWRQGQRCFPNRHQT